MLKLAAAFLAGLKTRDPIEVSVVVPVFNKAAYLSACLGSARAQTLKAVEILCVDDGSTDTSQEIAAQHANADARVILLSTGRNAGPGVARNLGLRQARGRFVFFLDADDVLPPDALEVLHALALSSAADLIKGTMANCIDGRDTPWISDETRIGNRDSFHLADEPRIWVPYFFVCYLYRREFLRRNNICFPPLRAGEDPVFLAQCLVKASKIASTSAVTYIYRRDGSKGQRRITPSHLADFVDHVDRVKRIYIEAGHERCWQERCQEFYLNDVRLLMNDVLVNEWERTALLDRLGQIWPGTTVAFAEMTMGN
jgi:glycosyltransferase involved in cell wall biosynthesis